MKITKFKSIAALLLCFTLILSSIAYAEASSSDNNIRVTLNGVQLEFDVNPFLDDSDRTMVEARGISEALGAQISWEADSETVTIKKDDQVLKLIIGESTYTINGLPNTMDTEAIIIEGRTMVPVRFVSEALGQTVAWDGINEVVVLTNDSVSQTTEESYSYTIVTTGQSQSFDNDGNVITPVEGEDYYGQDADYSSPEFSFTDNGDGTVTDNNTGLTWQQIPSDDQFSYEEAVEYCENLVLGGYDDWRLPTSKEMFNLSDFSEGWPFLDQTYFDFPSEPEMGGPGGGGPQGDSDSDTGMPEGADKEAGAALLDTEDSEMMPPPPTSNDTDDDSISKSQGQFWTDFYEVGTTHEGATSAFGVNHATGHIKAYPADVEGMGKFARAVRGDETSVNDFIDNSNGTVTDEATGLMWMQDDTGLALEWDEALEYAENFEYAGYDDWRLPDVKELQSIVDYSGVYPAIDQSIFTCTELEENEFYYFWTNTSAYFSTELPDYGYAWYVAFGYAVDDEGNDTHGAGAVRFSPKYTESEFAGEGGDNITNSVRLVRNIND